MNTDKYPTKRSSILRSFAYLVNRWVLRKPFLTAELSELELRFRVKTEDVVGRHIYKYHAHEPDLTALLMTELRFEAGDVVFDIGANLGWYSVILDRMAVAGVDIFSFEPDPLNFELLSDNLRLNGASHVHAFQAAVAAKSGSMRLYQHNSNNLGRHSLLPLQDGAAVDVKTITLNQFWEQQKLANRIPRFIKVDIEGYELLALRGASDILPHCPTVLCEFSPAFMRTGDINPEELISLFIEHGFTARRLLERKLIPIEPDAIRQLEDVTDLLWQKKVA